MQIYTKKSPAPTDRIIAGNIPSTKCLRIQLTANLHGLVGLFPKSSYEKNNFNKFQFSIKYSVVVEGFCAILLRPCIECAKSIQDGFNIFGTYNGVNRLITHDQYILTLATSKEKCSILRLFCFEFNPRLVEMIKH